jgi:hypothetical protein
MSNGLGTEPTSIDLGGDGAEAEGAVANARSRAASPKSHSTTKRSQAGPWPDLRSLAEAEGAVANARSRAASRKIPQHNKKISSRTVARLEIFGGGGGSRR